MALAFIQSMHTVQHQRQSRQSTRLHRAVYIISLFTAFYPCIVPNTLTLRAANRFAEACVG